MSLSIDEAIKKVLSFLKSIPMAPATVKYYSCCCSHVRDYCQRNALQEFSYKDAASFTAEQLKLAENGKFGKIYALIMRKAAYYVADCFETGCIYRIKLASCTENFRQVAGENLPPRRKGPPVMGSASRSGWQSVGSVIVVGNRDAILGQNSLQQLSAFQVKV